MIRAMMAEIQFVGFSAEREAENLMPEADAEHRLLAEHARDGSDAYGSAAGSPGPLERKIPSGLCARISSAVDVAGSTLTRKPVEVSRRRMLSLIP